MNTPILEIQGLHAGYGAHAVLNGIDLVVGRGDWFALLGPNGSGKSTLLHCVSGQLAPTSGIVRLFNHSIAHAPREAKRHLGYAHPPEQLPGLLTGRQCLEVYAAARQLSDIDETVLELAARFRLTTHLDQYVDTYSLGMRQKLSVLLALVGDPDLIVLDEAFNSLDPASALTLKGYLSNRLDSGRGAVLLATHALDMVSRYATRAALLLAGSIVKTWESTQIEAMHRESPESLELELAATAELTPT
jgi:ABC-2 type transport system ATP-binding protein